MTLEDCTKKEIEKKPLPLEDYSTRDLEENYRFYSKRVRNIFDTVKHIPKKLLEDGSENQDYTEYSKYINKMKDIEKVLSKRENNITNEDKIKDYQVLVNRINPLIKSSRPIISKPIIKYRIFYKPVKKIPIIKPIIPKKEYSIHESISKDIGKDIDSILGELTQFMNSA